MFSSLVYFCKTCSCQLLPILLVKIMIGYKGLPDLSGQQLLSRPTIDLTTPEIKTVEVLADRCQIVIA